MLIRIVKMHFKPENISAFEELFKERKEKIRSMPGCTHLQLLKDQKDTGIFFTISHWDSEQDLEFYRHSSLFKDTWQKTKALFSARAEAWSTIQQHQL